MKRTILLFIIIIVSSFETYSQQLPLGNCGIVCTYDAAGNRLRRLYFCNNGQPYPTKTVKQDVNATQEFVQVDALYPNPTTGKFFVTFSKKLKDAKVYLTDMNGKIIQQFIGSGYRLDFDLSNVAGGVYTVRIEDNGLVITKKVVKK
jgi:Secretion system C-terminal sorting domain